MGINFNDRILVTNPTIFFIGRAVLMVGITGIVVGVVTQYTDDFLIPATGWIAGGIPITVSGLVLMWNGLRKN